MTIFLLILASIVLIVVATSRLGIHPFLALLAAAFFFGVSSGTAPLQVIHQINDGFGTTLSKIGIVILLGMLIGGFLEHSGAAERLSAVILKMIGSRRVHLAMGLMGYLVSIPVFADSGFMLLFSLNKALSHRTSMSLAGTSLALAMGLMATHTMVPPTPGPIAAAGILNADLGLVILLGIPVSLAACLVTVMYSKYIGRKIPVPAEMTKLPEARRMPSALASFLPIVVPIFLIILKSLADYPSAPFGEGTLAAIFKFIGHPVSALSVGFGLALFLPEKWDLSLLGTSGWAGNALKEGAIILLITGAGGAFGAVLQASGIGDSLGGWVENLPLGLWLPFLVSGLLRICQGSSTVALITTASLMAPLLGAMGLDSTIDKALMVIAIGAGSTIGSHANDSFFWVMTQMSGLNVRQGFFTQTAGSTILGLSAMLLITLISIFT